MAKQLGYACINKQLRKQDIYTGRTMRRKTYDAKGLDYVSEICIANANDLIKIIQWNEDNNIKVFRMSSSIFPWMSEYEFTDLPMYKELLSILQQAGKLAKSYNQRLSFHPGQFCVLASPHKKVVDSAIRELNQASVIMDMMGLPNTRMSKINIHVGGAYGDKQAALSRFCANYLRTSPGVQSRLTVENDDKASMYSVMDLYQYVYSVVGIPIVFDYHHHKFCPGGLSEEGALKLAASTWGNIKPCTHYSESMLIKENVVGKKPQAHSDYIYDEINTYGLNIDIVVEAKGKELAVQQYFEKYGQPEIVTKELWDHYSELPNPAWYDYKNNTKEDEQLVS